jgi:hypothetical protein
MDFLVDKTPKVQVMMTSRFVDLIRGIQKIINILSA